jgi:hypothetical protein
VGLWLGALIALKFTSPLVMIAIAGAGAFVFGFTVLWIWITFMRRLPHLLSHHMAPREGTAEEHAAIAAAD